MTGRLYLACDMPSAEALDLCGGRALAFTARCPTGTGSNEDGAFVAALDPERGVLAVADGAGGGAGGERAARAALEALEERVQAARIAGTSLREAILSGFEHAQGRVTALGVGASTTLAVVEIDGGCVRTYHAGDSLILVVGQRGRRKLQTVSHSPVGYAVEAGLLDEGDALHHEDLHIVSNMIGVAGMRVEMSAALPLAPRDTLLLASDGVSDNLRLDELVEMVRKGPLTDVAQRLAAVADLRMRHASAGLPSKPDDVTFLLFRPGR